MNEDNAAMFDVLNVSPSPGMFMSARIDQLATALAKAQGQMRSASKDSVNPHFKSKYADLASVWEACREPLSANGLSVVQMPRADGKKVSLVYVLLHSSGQFIGSDLTMTAMQETPQAVGSCITYARRYTQASLAGIAQDDDDGNTASAKSPGDSVKKGEPSRYDGVSALHKAELLELARKQKITSTEDLKKLSSECVGVELHKLPAAVKEFAERTHS